MEGAFVLCQAERFVGTSATYIVNQNSPVVAGAGKYIIIVRMNGQPVDGFLMREEIDGVASATLEQYKSKM